MLQNDFPKISIVTPSFNQGKFLEAAIRSVVEQGYPNLEYVVIDGGSTDNSVTIIRQFQDRLTSWVSEPDGGHYQGINKGFARTTGEIMAWLNSDDKLTPWALDVVGEIFRQHPEIEWLTSLHPLVWDVEGRAVSCRSRAGFSSPAFFRGEYCETGGSVARDYIQQESTFWRRSLWDRCGAALDGNFTLAGDFELWARFFRQTQLYGVATPLGGFRYHGDQKTATAGATYLQEARRALVKHGGRAQSNLRLRLRRALRGVERRPLGRSRRDAESLPVCVYDTLEKKWNILWR